MKLSYFLVLGIFMTVKALPSAIMVSIPEFNNGTHIQSNLYNCYCDTHYVDPENPRCLSYTKFFETISPYAVKDLFHLEYYPSKYNLELFVKGIYDYNDKHNFSAGLSKNNILDLYHEYI